MRSFRKPARILGVSSAVICLLLWAYLAYSQVSNPLYDEDTLRTAAAMGLLALVGVPATLFDRPFFMIVIFLFAFFPTGFYLLGVPSIFRLIGLLDLLYLLAAVVLLYYRYLARYKA